MNQLTHLSLFSGFGGLDLAAEQEGFVTVGQCEWADYPTKVLEKHWPDVPRWRDIRTLTGDDFYAKTGLRTVDVLSGGFPCQPFSVAGQRRGTADDRFLWPEMLRIIAEIRPTWVLGENVAGLLSMAEPIGDAAVESRSIARYAESDYYCGVYARQEKMLLTRICEEIEACGYEVTVFCIPACGVDAPHKRDRIAIIAHSNGDGRGAQRTEPAGQQREAGAANGGTDVGNAQCDGLSAATITGGAGAHSDSRAQGAGEAKQPARAGGRNDDAALENARGGGREQPEVLPQQPRGAEPERASAGGAGWSAAEVRTDVADTVREPSATRAEQPMEQSPLQAPRFGKCRADVPNADNQRCEEQHIPTVADEAGFIDIGTDADATNAYNAGLQIAGQQPRQQAVHAGNGTEYGGWWPAEPNVGGTLDGFSTWLDSNQRLINETHERIISNGNILMGGQENGTKTETRSSEVLRVLRDKIGAENIQRGSGGHGRIHASEILLTYLCKLQEASKTLDHIPFESIETQEGYLRGMWMQDKSAGTSHRPEPREQRTREYPDALQTLSRLLAHDGKEAWLAYCREDATAFLGPWDGNWEEGVPRVAHGVPRRVERLKGLGNAAAPPQFRPIYRAIREAETIMRRGG